MRFEDEPLSYWKQKWLAFATNIELDKPAHPILLTDRALYCWLTIFKFSSWTNHFSVVLELFIKFQGYQDEKLVSQQYISWLDCMGVVWRETSLSCQTTINIASEISSVSMSSLSSLAMEKRYLSWLTLYLQAY